MSIEYKLGDVVVTKDGIIGSIIFFKYHEEEEFVLLRVFHNLEIIEVRSSDVSFATDEREVAIAKCQGYELLTNGHSLDDLVTILECRDLDFVMNNYHAAVGDVADVYIKTKELETMLKQRYLFLSKDIFDSLRDIKKSCGFSSDDDD